MGRLLDLLQAAAGEGSLRSRLGLWRQEVSAAIDGVESAVAAIVASGSAALSATQFLQVTQTGGNALVQLNTDLVLNEISAQRGVPYDTTTGIATLTAGRTYSLRAGGSMVSFVGGAPPFFDITWVDAVSNTPLVPNAVGTWIPVSDTANEAPSDAVEVVYTPTTNQTVKLRTVAGGGGTAQAVAGHFWSVVQQIG